MKPTTKEPKKTISGELALLVAVINVVNFSRYVNLENIFYAYVTHIVY